MNEKKVYLGDAVYCEFDGFCFTLMTSTNDRIVLEPEVYAELVKFVDSIKAANQMPTAIG